MHNHWYREGGRLTFLWTYFQSKFPKYHFYASSQRRSSAYHRVQRVWDNTGFIFVWWKNVYFLDQTCSSRLFVNWNWNFGLLSNCDQQNQFHVHTFHTVICFHGNRNILDYKQLHTDLSFSHLLFSYSKSPNPDNTKGMLMLMANG